MCFYELIDSKSNVDYIQLLQDKVGYWKLIGTRFIETPPRLIVTYMYLYNIGYDERKIEIKEKTIMIAFIMYWNTMLIYSEGL